MQPSFAPPALAARQADAMALPPTMPGVPGLPLVQGQLPAQSSAQSMDDISLHDSAAGYMATTHADVAADAVVKLTSTAVSALLLGTTSGSLATTLSDAHLQSSTNVSSNFVRQPHKHMLEAEGYTLISRVFPDHGTHGCMAGPHCQAISSQDRHPTGHAHYSCAQ